jgi:soluble lytic murein transglycosylase-like protein
MKSELVFCFAVCLAAACAMGGEFAVLSNGFRIHVDSHEAAGGLVTLHTGSGDIELPASSISRFEADDYVPPPQPAAVPAAPASPAPVDPKTLVSMAADAAGLPRALVHSVVRAESAYQVNAVSPKGAIGLMQLMPGTAAAMNADPHDPAQNVTAGAMYLRELLLKYRNSDHQVSEALAAYNAGPGAGDKYNGVPPYSETRAYVQRVISQYNKELPRDNKALPQDNKESPRSTAGTGSQDH